MKLFFYFSLLDNALEITFLSYHNDEMDRYLKYTFRDILCNYYSFKSM